MARKKPIVVDSGQLEQLQDGDDLDAPSLEQQLESTRRNLRRLLLYLVGLGFPVPAGLEEQFALAVQEST